MPTLLRGLWQRRKVSRELDDELRFHLDMEIDKHLARGLSPPEARRLALIELGGLDQIKEEVRDVRASFADALLRDVRYGIRLLLRRPGFTAAAILPLALALGLTTSIFSVVNAVLFRPLPYRDPGRLVKISEINRVQGAERQAVPLQSLIDWRERSKSLESVAGYGAAGGSTFLGEEIGEIQFALATPELFDVLGVRPMAGHIPLDEKSLLVSYRCWRDRLGSDRAVVGKMVGSPDDRRMIAGVMPEGFDFPDGVDAWSVWLFQNPRGRQLTLTTLDVVGRLRAGTDLQRARAELATIAPQLEREHPETYRNWRPVVVPLRDAMVGDSQPALLALFALVGFLLLLASVNLSSLLLARATDREREFAVRKALGAGRWAVARQVLVETLIIAIAASTLGFLLARTSVRALLALAPGIVARQQEVAVDWRVFLFALATAVAVAVACALVPALRLSASRAAGTSLQVGRSTSLGARTGRALDLLVVSEIALALVLLTGAGLATVSFARLRQVDPGFRPERLVAVRLGITQARWYALRARLAANPPPGLARDTDGDLDNREVYNIWNRDLLDRVSSIPGVSSAAVSRRLPFYGAQYEEPFYVAATGGTSAVRTGDPSSAGPATAPSSAPARAGPAGGTGRQPALGERFSAVIEPVTADYFRTLGIHIIRGRSFTADDRVTSAPVAIVNETLARRLWPHGDAIGQVITTEEGRRMWSQIVGVVADVRFSSLASPAKMEIFRPEEQDSAMGVLILRTNVDLSGLAPALRREVTAARFDVREIVAVADVMDRSVAKPRFTAVVVALFGGLGLVLTMSGVYGMLAFVVRKRRHEMAVRMALGAAPGHLVRSVVVKAVALAGTGVIVGLVFSVLLMRGARSLLFGVAPADPGVLVGASLLLILVALAASYLPARRGARTDPLEVLRSE